MQTTYIIINAESSVLFQFVLTIAFNKWNYIITKLLIDILIIAINIIISKKVIDVGHRSLLVGSVCLNKNRINLCTPYFPAK